MCCMGLFGCCKKENSTPIQPISVPQPARGRVSSQLAGREIRIQSGPPISIIEETKIQFRNQHGQILSTIREREGPNVNRLPAVNLPARSLRYVLNDPATTVSPTIFVNSTSSLVTSVSPLPSSSSSSLASSSSLSPTLAPLGSARPSTDSSLSSSRNPLQRTPQYGIPRPVFSPPPGTVEIHSRRVRRDRVPMGREGNFYGRDHIRNDSFPLATHRENLTIRISSADHLNLRSPGVVVHENKQH